MEMRVTAAENQSTPPPTRKRDQDIFKCKKMGQGKPKQLPEGERRAAFQTHGERETGQSLTLLFGVYCFKSFLPHCSSPE